MANYDKPKVQNRSFYGTLNKTLQQSLGPKYEETVILMINDELVYKMADADRIKFFSDIAIRGGAEEKSVHCRQDLYERLNENIKGSDMWAELDILDDDRSSILVPGDIEAILCDNARKYIQIRSLFREANVSCPPTFICPLPRNKVRDQEEQDEEEVDEDGNEF